MGPESITRPPIEQMPEAIAVSSMYPDNRVSLPMTMRTERPGSRRATNAMALPSRSATSGVMGGSLATPRIPSVPNSLRSATETLSVDFRLITEVHELELDPEVVSADDLHASLQVVPVLSGHAHGVFVDAPLHLELLILDQLGDLSGRLDGNAFL